jgi:hypothetical protein
MKVLSQMAIDLKHDNTSKFSKRDVNESFRNKILEEVGVSLEDIKNPKVYRRNKVALFELVEEAVNVLIEEGIKNQFDSFVETSNIAFGNQKTFKVPDTATFAVATIADGTQNLRRQRLDAGNLTVTTSTKGIKVYEEYARFLAGDIDWENFINKLVTSYNNQIAVDIYTALYGAYDNLSAPYAVSGAFVASEMDALIDHVSAATNADCTIWGTKASLRKVTPAEISDAMKQARNEMGYYGVFNGTPMNAIKQAHTPGTNTFAIGSNFAMIIPNIGDRIIKLVYEGDAIIEETPVMTNQDMSMEYLFIKKYGVAVIAQGKYGIWRFA